MDPISHTQHRPICVTVNHVVVKQPTPLRNHFNLRKADWNGYSTELDKLIEDIEPIQEYHNRFVEYVRVVSRKYIPRGCRTEYIPGLTEESKSLYETYKKHYVSSPFSSSTMKYGTKLLDKMTDEKIGGSHHNNEHDT